VTSGEISATPVDDEPSNAHLWGANVSIIPARVRFEHAGARLTAVEIVRGSRRPVITSLHRALLALGIVVSSYEARAAGTELTERIVIELRDGGSVEEQLSERTKDAILRIAVDGA
jgi:hypothetical protein